MNNLKKSTQIILKELATSYPDSTQFRKNAIVEVGKELGPFNAKKQQSQNWHIRFGWTY